MRGRNCPQCSLLARDLGRLSYLEELPRVKAGEDIADDVSRSKSEGYSEGKGAGRKHDGGHEAEHLGVDFELFVSVLSVCVGVL